MSRGSIVRGVLAGAVAGAAASFVMNRFQAATQPLLPSYKKAKEEGKRKEPSTEKAADAISRGVFGREVPDIDKKSAGQAVHYATGIALGIGYALAAEFRPAVTTGFGAAFGVATATLIDQGAVPALGFGKPAWEADAATNLYSYASHLVFGVTTELVRRTLG